MKNVTFNLVLFFILIFLGACRNEDVIPESKAFLKFEMDGKVHKLVEGDPDVNVGGVFSSSTENTYIGHGASFREANGNNWSIRFFFDQTEFENNIENSANLFKVGQYDFVKLDENYQPLSPRGVEIGYSYPIPDYDGYNFALYSRNSNNPAPQHFEVTKVYFDDISTDRFIWVEGNFDVFVGSKEREKRIKGDFRVMVQVN